MIKKLEHPIWHKYRRQVLFLLNEMCKITNPFADSYFEGDEKGEIELLIPLNLFWNSMTS
jgi:hypothetical protein